MEDKEKIIDEKNISNNSLIEPENYSESKEDLITNNANDENKELEGKKDEEEEAEAEEKEEVDPSKEIELLYTSLFELFSKKQFKKIIKTIVLKADKEEKYNLLEWKLLYLRSVCLHKIIEKKNSKYYKSSKNHHFSDYVQKLNNDIDHWISFTQELTKQNEKLYFNSFLEFIITFILQECIALSKNYIHLGNIKDAVGILSLAVRLINKSINFVKSPDSYALAGEIFLNLSSFMIAEEKYESAKTFISISIKLSYLSFEAKLFKNGINYYLWNIKEYINELPQISKLFFNLSVAFYQLGICYENEGDPYNAVFAMKTAKYFGNHNIENDFKSFLDYIKDIETRLLMRNRIILFFERKVKKYELEEEEIRIKKVYNKIYNHEEKRRLRFNRLQNHIDKMKLIDVDDEEPDLFNKIGCKPLNDKVLYTTKHIHLLNFLMSDDFKEVIHKMKKIEINKLEKDTINKIQKKIIS